MKRSYKFRLYPNHAEEEQLFWTLDMCRHTYNRLLEELNKQSHPDRAILQAMLPIWKKENPELKGVHSKTLQYECHRLFSSLHSLAELKKRGHKVGRLRFKGKHWFKTFTYNQSGFEIIKTDTRLSVLRLSKIGDIPIRLHRPIEGVVKQVTIKHTSSGEWYAYVQTNDGKPRPKKVPIERAVGIDVGLIHYAVDSDGRETKNPRWLKHSLKQLRREQRRLSRKEKGSMNREKQRVKVAKVYEHVVNQRDDFLHKLSRYYVDNYDLIATEDLDITGMLNKRGLNRGIYDASWKKLNMMLSYKAVSAGKTHVVVEPRGTTQECSRCGCIVVKTLDERVHKCPNCGLVIGRDHNSSRVILKRGYLKVGREPPEHTPAETGPLPRNILSDIKNPWQAQAMKQEATPFTGW